MIARREAEMLQSVPLPHVDDLLDEDELKQYPSEVFVFS